MSVFALTLVYAGLSVAAAFVVGRLCGITGRSLGQARAVAMTIHALLTVFYLAELGVVAL